MKLENKVCIITGASRGIGKAFALGFAKEGADIVVAARTEVQKDERLPGTIHETADMVRALGRRAVPIKTDVSKEEDVNRMVQAAIDEFGKVDIMLHNAALAFWHKLYFWRHDCDVEGATALRHPGCWSWVTAVELETG